MACIPTARALELKRKDDAELGSTRQPYCVIVGGGQGGIALAARLKRSEVSTIVLEKNARAGDSWRNRYPSLCLHDPVWYDRLPCLPFPEHWPAFSPKDKLGDWLETYVKVMQLNYWTCSPCVAASYPTGSMACSPSTIRVEAVPEPWALPGRGASAILSSTAKPTEEIIAP